MEPPAVDPAIHMLLSFLPLVLLTIPFAIGNFFLARRIEGASPAIWVISSLIPFANMLFMYYVLYRVIYAVLDYLREIRDRS
ncbi:hypothetical protein [Amaricoccus macauensis]|uniref:hypothetical protein n=1 Tax=Amaricoccus macauensis TaxID=57001 RepID=UPI003C7AD904